MPNLPTSSMRSLLTKLSQKFGLTSLPSAAMDGETPATGLEAISIETTSVTMTPTSQAMTILQGGRTSADEHDPDERLLPAPAHVCDLLEAHVVMTELDLDSYGWTRAHDVAQAHVRSIMTRWCDAHGVEPMHVESIDSPGNLDTDVPQAGVRWTVTVGKADVSLDQRAAGTLDSWTWSGRVEHWRAMFGHLEGGRQGRRLPELSKRTKNPFRAIAEMNDDRIATVTPISERRP